MNPLNDLGVNLQQMQQTSLVNLILSGVTIWAILSVVGVAMYRLFRGQPAGLTNEFQATAPKKKKRG
jgi:hypothetical protein